MDKTQLYCVPGTPGRWQYWAEAGAGDIWLVAADATAEAFMNDQWMLDSNSKQFYRVARDLIELTTGLSDQETLF